jgi:hypothetical protein
MRTVALLLLLISLTLALKQTSRQQKMVENLMMSQQSTGHTCMSAVYNLKSYSNYDWKAVLYQNTLWTDPSFDYSQNYYWNDTT